MSIFALLTLPEASAGGAPRLSSADTQAALAARARALRASESSESAPPRGCVRVAWSARAARFREESGKGTVFNRRGARLKLLDAAVDLLDVLAAGGARKVQQLQMAVTFAALVCLAYESHKTDAERRSARFGAFVDLHEDIERLWLQVVLGLDAEQNKVDFSPPEPEGSLCLLHMAPRPDVPWYLDGGVLSAIGPGVSPRLHYRADFAWCATALELNDGSLVRRRADVSRGPGAKALEANASASKLLAALEGTYRASSPRAAPGAATSRPGVLTADRVLGAMDTAGEAAKTGADVFDFVRRLLSAFT